MPGVLEARGLLAAGGLDVEAPRRAVVGAPHRAALLLPCLAVDGLAVAPVLRAVAVEHVHHVLQAMPRAEPGGNLVGLWVVRWKGVVISGGKYGFGDRGEGGRGVGCINSAR